MADSVGVLRHGPGALSMVRSAASANGSHDKVAQAAAADFAARFAMDSTFGAMRASTREVLVDGFGVGIIELFGRQCMVRRNDKRECRSIPRRFF